MTILSRWSSHGNSFKAHAGSYPLPSYDLPAPGVFDPPLTEAGINATWAGWIAGALQPLALDDFWNDGDGVQRVEALIAYLASGEPVMSGGDFPTGGMIEWPADSLPAGGWLWCDGSAVSRATYADLFAAIGETFGAGDGSTTFNLPDRRGRFGLGKDDMGGIEAHNVTDPAADVLGGTSGAETHQLTLSQMAEHRHGNTTSTKRVASGSYEYAPADSDGRSTAYAGSNQPHNNVPPFVTMNYVIKT